MSHADRDNDPAIWLQPCRSESVPRNTQEHLNKLTGALRRMNPHGGKPIPLFVPGRIEVLGKHVDYAGGQSLTCATEQGICLLVSPRQDSRIRIVDPEQNLEASFPIDPELTPLLGDWTNYPMTVARRYARNFPPVTPGQLTGCDIAMASNLPRAAGLSSSSALITAVFLAIASVNKLHLHPGFTRHIRSRLDLADYLGCVENGSSFGELPGDRGVGTRGGCQDHAAILCAEAGQLSLFAYRPVRLIRRVALPKNFLFVIAVSGVHAVKTGNVQQNYNNASELAQKAIALWNQHTGRNDAHLGAVLASSSDAAKRMRHLFAKADTVLRERVEQFIEENSRIVPEAIAALDRDDLNRFGQLAQESQHGAENGLHNQVPQTVYLARRAYEHGAIAASAFGAGFGGSVWALVHTDTAEAMINRWSEDYRQAFPKESEYARFITTRPGPRAMRVSVDA